jgi:hypothetical protein
MLANAAVGVLAGGGVLGAVLGGRRILAGLKP